MKATFGNSFAKRSLVIAVTALPSLYSGLASAQAAPPPPPPAAPAAPVPAAPIAGEATPTPATPVAAPPVVAPQAVEAPPAPPADAAPPAPPPPPVDPDAEMYKKINIGVWSRIGFGFQKADNPKKIDGVGTGGEVELHTSGKMRKWLAWTANFAASFGAPDGGSFKPGSAAGLPGGTISGALEVQDLIAQFEPDPLFNLWVGRHLVASDRSNFAGPYFMAPWIYPLFLGPQGNPYAVVGPKEGPYGRSDGATVWGQVDGGTFKYFLGAYDLYDAVNKPLISGRVSVSLLNPEPGYWGTSTYHGMDLFSVGLGGQYSKNSDTTVKPGSTDPQSDYGLVNADLLFEKKLDGGSAFDVEGAFYKYVGDGQSLKFSYMALVSYLTPELSPGMGHLQPLVRIQQAKQKSAEDASNANGNLVTQTDIQMNYVLDSYATRFSLGFTHGSAGDGASYSNAAFLGVQLQK